MFRNRLRFALLLLLLLLLLFLSTPATAQVNTAPDDEANWQLAAQWSPDDIWELSYSNKVQPHWIDGGDAFWYRFLTGEGLGYWLVEPDRSTRESLFDTPALAAELQEFADKELDASKLDLKKLSFRDEFRWIDFEYEGARYEYDRQESRLAFVDSVATPTATEPWRVASPDGRWSVFTRGNDLYVVGADESLDEAAQLSSDGAYALSWGEDWELIANDDKTPRTLNVIWSPDSSHFCVKRADMRQVEELWLVDHLADPRPTLKTIKVPPVGGKVPQWELWIGNCESAALTRVAVERWPDQTLEDLFAESVWWTPDASALFFTRRHRDYMQVDVCVADPATGATRVLIEERVNGMVYTRTPTPLFDRGEALWWSMRDGWGHLYRYGLDGTLQDQLTTGAWTVDDVLGLNADGTTVFFRGLGREKGRNPYYRYLYSVQLEGGEPRLLTPEDAEHESTLSPSGSYFVDSYSRVDLPTRTVLRDAEGKLIMELEIADTSSLTEAGWQAPESFHALGADGTTEQWGAMWKPFNFDPERKYPIVTKVYPGRQSEFIPREFSPIDIETSLAQLGCIVVRFGNRGGTPERGLEYREYGRDDFRDYGLADKKTVIENLAAQHPWIDAERVGIYGGSSGGFMTVSAMLVHPEFFKVGVAMSGPNDPTLYYNHWVERYAGVTARELEDGSVAWDAGADGNIELAENLSGRLLMIYGAQDDNVHPLHLYRQAHAFIEAGKRFDMFVVPGGDHGLGGWRHLYGMVLDYFGAHLIGGYRASAECLFTELESTQ